MEKVKSLAHLPHTGGTTHGGNRFVRTGRLPSIRGKRKIEKRLNELRTRLMEVVPNSQDPRKAVLIEQIVQSEGFQILVGEYVKRVGILNPRKFRQGLLELQPVLGKSLIGFMNSQRQAIGALGMSTKQAEDILDIQDYVRQYDAKKQETSEQKPEKVEADTQELKEAETKEESSTDDEQN